LLLQLLIWSLLRDSPRPTVHWLAFVLWLGIVWLGVGFLPTWLTWFILRLLLLFDFLGSFFFVLNLRGNDGGVLLLEVFLGRFVSLADDLEVFDVIHFEDDLRELLV